MREKSAFGDLYWGVRIARMKKPRTLYVYADRIEVKDGDLLLYFNHSAKGETLHRAFARGTWQDIFAASCIDGTECGEEHDFDDATAKDARTGLTAGTHTNVSMRHSDGARND